MTWHVTPIDDLEEHEESTTCKCEPRVEYAENGDMIVVHMAFDGRHVMEWIDEILKNKKP